jgi:hypothetical protein
MSYKTPDNKYIVKIGYTTNLEEMIKQLNNEYIRPGNICNNLYIFNNILFCHLLKLISDINQNNDSIEIIKEKTK